MKVKKTTSTNAVVFMLLSGVVIVAVGQPATNDRGGQDTQVRGNWTDLATGLMWAAKDNGKDITWGKATTYCSNLRLAGYSDWRLPTVDELERIYDGSGFSAPPPREGAQWALAGKPMGGLMLTGNHHWSSTKGKDDRGHTNGYACYFDFSHGRRDWDPYGYHGNKRALCVRRSGQ